MRAPFYPRTPLRWTPRSQRTSKACFSCRPNQLFRWSTTLDPAEVKEVWNHTVKTPTPLWCPSKGMLTLDASNRADAPPRLLLISFQFHSLNYNLKGKLFFVFMSSWWDLEWKELNILCVNWIVTAVPNRQLLCRKRHFGKYLIFSMEKNCNFCWRFISLFPHFLQISQIGRIFVILAFFPSSSFLVLELVGSNLFYRCWTQSEREQVDRKSKENLSRGYCARQKK